MFLRLLLAALVAAPAVAHADDKGEIDWSKRVIRARGQGAPDLSAASISVARLGAERAAKADAMRNLLETLKGATVESGARVGTLLQDDKALSVKVQGALRGFRVPTGTPGNANPKYYSDGGVAIVVELPIDTLPEELRAHLKPPPGAAAVGQGGEPAEVPNKEHFFLVDIKGLGDTSDQPPLADESGQPVPIEVMKSVPERGGTNSMLRAVRVSDGVIVISDQDAARMRKQGTARVYFIR